MDHGANNSTCSLLWAVGHDGNCLVCDEYYSLAWSDHTAEVGRRRQEWWQTSLWSTCLGGPSIGAKHGLERDLGDPASVATVPSCAHARICRTGIRLLDRARERKSAFGRINGEVLGTEGRMGEPSSPRVFG
jgi:hypothetical protein